MTTGNPLDRKMTENESMGRAYGRGVGFYLGEPCDDRCNGILVHVYCNTTTKQCECKQDYPVKIQNRKCAKAARLNENCEHTESCTYFDEHAVCSTDDGKCRCTTNYIIKPGSENTEAVCIQGNNTGFMDNSDMTTMISVIAGLMIFTALFCLVLRLFSRARFNRPRDRIGNASAPSVVLTGLETSGGAPNSASSSRRASRSSGSNQDPYKNRRHSCSAATLAPPSLSGSRRPSSTSVRSQGSLRSHGSSSFRSQSSLRASGARPGPSTGSSFRGYPGLPGLTGGTVCSIHGGREPVRRTASSPASDSHHYPPISGPYRAPTTSSHGGQTLIASSSHSPSSMETATRTDSLQGASYTEAEIT